MKLKTTANTEHCNSATMNTSEIKHATLSAIIYVTMYMNNDLIS